MTKYIMMKRLRNNNMRTDDDPYLNGDVCFYTNGDVLHFAVHGIGHAGDWHYSDEINKLLARYRIKSDLSETLKQAFFKKHLMGKVFMQMGESKNAEVDGITVPDDETASPFRPMPLEPITNAYAGIF